MILAFAGRRAGSDAFPTSNVEFVSGRIRQLVGGLRPRVVVGSAAAGADLLTIEAALGVGAAVHVYLAGDRAGFRTTSVIDKGENWGRRYDALLDLPEVNVHELELAESSDASYRAVTMAIVEQAQTLVEQGEEVVGLAVSAPRDTGTDHTEELVERLRASRALALRIDPEQTEAEVQRAFVAMPFGIKPYPDREWSDFDADASYHRIIAPALIDAGYRPLRADTDALLEVIDHTMLREISSAPVMVVDLAGLNANVFWELGVRHAWRRAGTILMGPEWVKPPFDVARSPVHRYRRSETDVADGDAVAGIRTLRDALTDVQREHVDSPVFAAVGTLEDVEVPVPPGPAAESTAGDLLAEITLATDLRRPRELRALRERVNDAQSLPSSTQSALLEQIGLGLIAFNQHAEAVAILAPIAAADKLFERRRLQEQYAHALIRAEGAGEDENARLTLAERILRALVDRRRADGETYGLLGSASKRRVERALEEHSPIPRPDVERAIDAYLDGLRANPGDAYPGINAILLLRLDAQRWDGAPDRLADARGLIPVVRFAVERRGELAADDAWAQLTLAECALHRHLLDGDGADLDEATRRYAAAAALLSPQQRRSATRQLDFMRRAGDPEHILGPIIELLS